MPEQQDWKNGQVDNFALLKPVHFIVFFLLLFFCWFQFKNFLFSQTPKFVPQLSGPELIEKLQNEKEPVFVFFYHSPRGEAARAYFPVLNQLAARFDSKIHFYRYQLSQKYPDPFFNDIWRYDAAFVLFKDGVELKRSPILLSTKAVNRGFAFLVIKDYVGLQKFDSSGSTIPPIQYVDVDNFPELVLNSKNFVIINFTSPTCPAAIQFKPDFKRIAVANQHFADFYLCDVTRPGNKRLQRQVGMSTPTIALFYQGELKATFSGGTDHPQANEAIIFGLLVPQL